MKLIWKLLNLIVFASATLLYLSACKSNTGSDSDKAGNESDSITIDSISSEINTLTDKIKKNPDEIANYYKRSLLYNQTGKKILAVQDMETLLEKDSSNIEHYIYIADLYFDLSNLKGCTKAVRKALLLDPDNELANLKMGELYLILEERKKAFESLNKALRKNKYNPRTYYLKAWNYMEMGDTIRAISNLQTSIDVDPDYYDSYDLLGLLFSLKKDKKAIAYYDNALRLSPGNMKIIYNKAKLYQDIEEFEEAIRLYEEILDTDPDHKNANYNLGFIYYLKAEYDKSIQFFSSTIAGDPENKDAYFGRGLCYMEIKNFDMAESDFKKILELDPNDQDAKIKLRELIDNS